jgi:alpha-D-xyloside xylohydrolase
MLRSRVLLLCVGLLFGFFNTAFAIPDPSFIKTPDGVIVYTDPLFTGVSRPVKLVVVSDHIIRVVASPEKELPTTNSLITVFTRNPDLTWTTTSDKEKVVLKTKALTAQVHLRTGAVSFFDASGKKILAEKQTGGRSFEPAVFEGQRLYHIKQTFQATADDAYYGLGQHQDDVYNYKGQQVFLFQNNTEVGVPFLISHKNYGILWDNYSLTRAGDTRDYHPLSALQLFSKEGEVGWLTATYSNDKKKPAEAVLQRAETTIDMEYLNESKIDLPAEFKPANGVVNWEGSIVSQFDGAHKFRFIYGGYIKVWVGGKLVIDRWRKAWNPAPALIDVPMQKGQKLPVRIEWIPEGSESYLAVKWLEPVPAAEQNMYSFDSEAGKQLDYYFIHGNNMDEVISGYRFLTGKAPIMPKWALGFWQSRERYKTQGEILETVAEFRKRKIPLDNIVLDWSYWREAEWGSQDFDETRFSNPDSMIKVLHDQYNTKIMISVWPKFYEGIPAYNEMNSKGWLYKRNVADRQRDWIGKGYISTFYDAFNEGARKGFWSLIYNKIYKKGIDAWWMDASEPDILSNVSPQKRKEQMAGVSLGAAAEYVNAYPLQNAKGIYEGQRSVDPNRRVFLLTRSGFAGSQRYAAAIWSGDIGARWFDMKAQIPAGINFSMSGIPYWTMDIGGFVVEGRFEKPKNEADLEEWRELNTRWFQFGAFVPLFRAHGQFPYREIYNIAPESHVAYQSMLYYNKLRYRLMPYIYSLAGSTYHNNYTMMRGLVMDFAKDTAVLNIGDQFMFGPSLLVSPVYNYQQRTRELYLPKGQGWYDLYTGKYNQGGQKITAEAPYERMPVYVKEGSIVPFGPELQYTSEKPADTITLYVYTGKDASFQLYEDQGTTYDYEKGQYATIPFQYNESTRTLTIGDRKGSYPGMLTTRTFRVVQIAPTARKALDMERRSGKEIIYQGKKQVIKF